MPQTKLFSRFKDFQKTVKRSVSGIEKTALGIEKLTKAAVVKFETLKEQCESQTVLAEIDLVKKEVVELLSQQDKQRLTSTSIARLIQVEAKLTKAGKERKSLQRSELNLLYSSALLVLKNIEVEKTSPESSERLKAKAFVEGIVSSAKKSVEKQLQKTDPLQTEKEIEKEIKKAASLKESDPINHYEFYESARTEILRICSTYSEAYPYILKLQNRLYTNSNTSTKKIGQECIQK